MENESQGQPPTTDTSPAPDLNGQPPKLGVVRKDKSRPSPPPPPEHLNLGAPPPAFSAAPATSPAPSVVGRRRAARGAPASGIGPERLPEPYRSLCPAELRGEPMMEWYFAVQAGERLVLGRAQTLEGISAQLADQGEMLGDVIRLIESLGRGMAQVIDTVRRQGAGPVNPVTSPVPLVGDTYAGAALAPRREVSLAAPQMPAPVPTAEDAPYEPPPPPAVDPMQVMLSRTPAGPARLTNKDAAAIREYARSLVPIAGIPWAADQQIGVAAEIAEECLSLWAGPGKTAPSRWPDYVRSAIIDRLGIDKARGD